MFEIDKCNINVVQRDSVYLQATSNNFLSPSKKSGYFLLVYSHKKREKVCNKTILLSDLGVEMTNFMASLNTEMALVPC